MSLLSRKRRRDIRGHRWQFLSVTATVVIGVMLFCASYDAYRNLYVSYNSTYDRLVFADVTVTGAQDRFVSQVRAVPGAEAVEERVSADVKLRIDGREFAGRTVGLPTNGQPAVNKVDVVDGDYLTPNASERVLVETHLAEAYDLAPGDVVELLTPSGWRKLTMAGEVVSAEYLWPAPSNQQLFASPEDFGVLFVDADLVPLAATPAVQNQVLVRYAEDVDRDAIDRRVRQLADDAGADDVQLQEDQPSNKALSLDLQGFEQMAWLFPAMFLLAAGLASYLLLTRIVFSQRDQIGTLRANGLSRSAVLGHYLGYGLWVGLWGASIGVLLGVPAGWAITGAYTSELGIPDTVRQLRLITPTIGLSFGLAAGLLAAWVPARLAVSIEPAEAMRGTAPSERGRRSGVEVLVPSLRHLKVRWRMVLRGFGRNPRRSLSTIVGIVLALVLLLTSWGMLDTTAVLMDKQFNQIQLEDAQVVPRRGLDDPLLSQIRAVDGVRVAEQVMALDISASGPLGSYSTQLLAFAENTQMHAFGTSGDTPPPGDVLVGPSVVDKTGVPVGTQLTLRSPSLDTGFALPIGATVDEPLGTFVYASQPTLLNALREAGIADPESLMSSAYSVAFVQFEPGADREQVIGSLRDLTGVSTVSDSREIYNLVQGYLGFFYLFIGMMLVFGGTMALALIFNTVSVNLAERSSELASMRANGMSKGIVASIVTAENLILTAIGVIPGLIIGTWAADAFLSTYNSDLFAFDLVIKPGTYILASLAMFAVTGLSLLPGIRAVGRVDIAKVVREKSV
ncbi:MAG TPA: FtsX-like permease family protein [Coriobacteriia bacterium]|nr:FtsX-like permease family protein [Coriobacteriia bacterium]